MSAPTSVGHLVAEQLVACGVDTVFAVAGESYLALLDGLHEQRRSIRTVTARHEGGASMMAAAHGRLTGRPAVCAVTRGPGATNASIGVHIASQDGVPMLLLVGQVPTSEQGRRSFQEIDLETMFGPVAKAVVTLTDAESAAGVVARAHGIAVDGEPGPVVVVMPEDVLMSPTAATTVAAHSTPPTAPSQAEVAAVAGALGRAERPLIILGGAGWDTTSLANLRTYAEASSIPVMCAFRQQDLVDNDSPVYAGALGLLSTPGTDPVVAEADLLVLLGPRPDASTRTALERACSRRTRVMHVHTGPAEALRVPVELDVVCEASAFARSLSTREPVPRSGAWRERAREGLLSLRSDPPDVDAAAYLEIFDEQLPSDVIVTCGAGTYTSWPQRYHRFRTYPSQVATQAGAMGYGLPAAIAAKLAFPERMAVVFAGDGCLQMSGHDLATAVQHGLPIVVVVVNNGSFGAIRLHQERHFPGHRIATDLTSPDFVTWARSFGLDAERVSSPSQLRSVLPRLLEHDKGALIEIVVA